MFCNSYSTKLYSFCQIKVLRFNLYEKKTTWRKCSSQPDKKEVDNQVQPQISQKKKALLIVPSLSVKRINEINTVTGICLEGSLTTWIKISIKNPEMTVLDWNAKTYAESFAVRQDEPSILKWAYTINKSIPKSDLYVMETFSLRGKQFYERLNILHLSSMLTVLLNGLDTDPSWQEKVIFQKKFVLNKVHDLLVGGERKCVRELVENIINKSENINNEIISPIYSTLEFNKKCLKFFKDSSNVNKEELSLAFLLTLTFIDINIFNNEKILLKIIGKKQKK